MHILCIHNGNAIGFVKFAGHLGQQFVGGHADRAGQARGIEHGFLHQARQAAPALALPAGHLGQVQVHLVYAPVFHQRRNFGQHAFKLAREFAVFLKIHWQQQRLRAQLGRLHHAHGRAYAKLARCISGCGDHPAPGVVSQHGEGGWRDLRDRRVGILRAQSIVQSAPTAAYHHRQALELRVTQQLYRCVEGIHVQVGNAAQRHGGV